MIRSRLSRVLSAALATALISSGMVVGAGTAAFAETPDVAPPTAEVVESVQAPEAPAEPVVEAPAEEAPVAEAPVAPVEPAVGEPAEEPAPAVSTEADALSEPMAADTPVAEATLAVSSSALVSVADETGLTVDVAVAGIEDAATAYPNGVHVGVVLRGTADGATQDKFLGATASIGRGGSMPADGTVEASVAVAAADLDRAKEYEAVVWPQRSYPTAANIVTVAEFDVSEAQWDAVFGPVDPTAGAITATVTGADKQNGLEVEAVVTNISMRPGLNFGVYVTIVETDRVNELETDSQAGFGTTWVKQDEILNGGTTQFLTVTPDQLDRTKQYSVVSWRAHGFLTADSLVAKSALVISEANWDTLFPPIDPSAGTIAVSVTNADPESGLQMNATVGNISLSPKDQGVYVTVIENSRIAELESDAQAGLDSKHVESAEIIEGVTTQNLKVPAKNLDRSKKYSVVSWKAHGFLTEDSFIAQTDVNVSEAQWDAVLPGTVPEPTPEPSTPPTETKPDLMAGSFEWGVRDKFQDYVTGPIAGGKITVMAPATGTSVYKFPQVAGGSWNDKKQSGTVNFAGNVNFTGHGGELNLNLANPQLNIVNSKTADLNVAVGNKVLTIAKLDLSAGTKKTDKNGEVRYTNVPVKATSDGLEKFFNGYLNADDPLNTAAFTIGAAANVAPVTPPTTPSVSTKPKTENAVKPAPTKTANGSKSAGSLSWGISSGFANYTTGRIAKGSIATNGVGASGGAYLFPQANDTWNAESQTGTVQYSGVVTFTGHKNAMVETFANPTITVSSASSATMNVGGRSFALDLSAANKSVGANGEVSWSGVPVGGSISGSGAGGGGAFPPDSLSFSVGTASDVSYGSTAVSNDDKKRTVAETAPTTTGIRVLTAPEDITPGAELEFEATGFEADERDVIVAMYPGIVVLDEAAGANAVGAIRWIGTLPEDIEAGEYIITAQGSIDVGAVFTVVDEKKAKAAKKANNTKTQLAQGVNEDAVTAAGIAPEASGPVWLWWTVAGALLVIAATMGGLVIARRRAAV